ncbi:MAG: aspartate kinase, partial [Lachnospiraceae bacterium]|nr:aspartate kinase [Lachnospiraceae bacterium]
MIKVVKFGGSSLANAEQFKKVKDIIKSDSSRRFVVPSAPGKRFSADTKVTDMLYACYKLAEEDSDFDDTLKAIHDRYQEIIDGLSLKASLDDAFETIKKDFKAHAGREYAASRGEYLNGMLMAEYLGFPFLDSAEFIFFNEDGTFDAEKTNATLSKKLAGMQNAVIPGFYGSLPNGRVKTFSRGGSDITGSI